MTSQLKTVILQYEQRNKIRDVKGRKLFNRMLIAGGKKPPYSKSRFEKDFIIAKKKYEELRGNPSRLLDKFTNYAEKHKKDGVKRIHKFLRWIQISEHKYFGRSSQFPLRTEKMIFRRAFAILEGRWDFELDHVDISDAGGILRYASKRLRDDKPTVMTAVASSPIMLKYASKRLKDDNDVVEEAFNSCIEDELCDVDDVLDFASERLQRTFRFDEEDAEIIKKHVASVRRSVDEDYYHQFH